MLADASEADRVARQSILASMDKTLVLTFASQKQMGGSTAPLEVEMLSPQLSVNRRTRAARQQLMTPGRDHSEPDHAELQV
jgi:short subunit dehydrogenase-like uncharacterized protein